ncbi:MAG: hypothetical protein OEZ06_05500 [Myxococcales bacterium]|nr:hypothetical protein [Myxococcales bacterium]
MTDQVSQHAQPYGLIGAAAGGALINALINGGLAWLLFRPDQQLALWALPGTAFDVVAMCFGIAFGTGLVLTPQLRRQQRDGRVTAPALPPERLLPFSRWPAGVFHRAFNLGALSVLLFAPPTITLLWLAGLDAMGYAQLIAFKAAFGAVHGALVTPIIGVGALVEPGTFET